jgi:hypothetical protein
VAEAGTVHHLSLDQIRAAIGELGYVPRQRNVRYELFDEDRERWAIDANHARYEQIRARQRGHVHHRIETVVPLTIVAGDSTA